MQAYRAKVTARTGLLLGGQKTHHSHPFETFKLAVQWADNIIAINKVAGRDPMYDGIRQLESSNPITEAEGA